MSGVRWFLADVKYRTKPDGLVTDAAAAVAFTFASTSDEIGEPAVLRNFSTLFLVNAVPGSDSQGGYYRYCITVPSDKILRLNRMDIPRDLVSAVMPIQEIDAPTDLMFGGNMVRSSNRSKDRGNKR